MAELEALRNQLRDEHAEAWKLNLNSEKIQTVAFDGADKQYTESLDSYDNDMREKNKERDDTEADLKDQEYQLSQIKEQWNERVEERRKREALQLIMRKKEEQQKKEMDTLNKAA